MSRKSSACVALLIMVAISATSHGQTTLNGGTHTINGPSGPLLLINGATLNVVSPASVTATNTSNAIYGDSSTTINLLGGQVTGGSNGDLLPRPVYC